MSASSRSTKAPNLIPVRVELTDGFGAWRGLPDLQHDTICKAFSLDVVTTWFDMPSSFWGLGPTRTGGGGGGTGGRTIDGLIFQGPKDSDPIGKIIVAREGEKFRDYDNTDKSEFFKLGRH